jgi:hypothetical protein
MEATTDCGSTAPARSFRITGWTVLQTLLVLFLLVDGVAKILRFAPYVEGTVRVGYSASCVVPLGLVLVACTVLYVVPRTAMLGAILLTGYLGGATATHVRMGEPFVFPVAFGVLVWVCLVARDARLRALLSSRSTSLSN